MNETPSCTNQATQNFLHPPLPDLLPISLPNTRLLRLPRAEDFIQELKQDRAPKHQKSNLPASKILHPQNESKPIISDSFDSD